MRKYILLLVLVFALSNGIVFPKKPGATDEWQQQFKKYSQIYWSIQKYYPEAFDAEKLFFASISGLLKKLDPHSYFLDPVAVRSLDEDQQGNYYGIGTRITQYEDRLTVVAPLVGTPAYKLGILAGDVIAEIDGTDTRPLSLDDAMKLLRGAKGTEVSIKIRREGIADLIPFKIKRAEIPLNSISYSLTHPEAPGIGFISIRTFGNTTVKEFTENIEKLLKENKIKALILDLRGNAGGALYPAIELADLFLEKGKTIVSVKGRAFGQSYKAKKDGPYQDLPAAVLINRGSASASEIVASALQDNKRAVIIGTRSWGKGLVQTVSRLSLNSSVALTTAKYYTPLNKSLQRDFNERDDYFFFLNTNTDYDTDKSIEGGVIPDISVKSAIYPGLLVNFISRGIFFKFARQLIDSESLITIDFKVDSKILTRFKNFLKEKQVTYDAEEFTKHLKTIRFEIEREVLANKFSPAEGVKVFLKSDPVTQKAVGVLEKKYN